MSISKEQAANIANNLLSDHCWCLWEVKVEDIMDAAKDSISIKSQEYKKWFLDFASEKENKNSELCLQELEDKYRAEISKHYYLKLY